MKKELEKGKTIFYLLDGTKNKILEKANNSILKLILRRFIYGLCDSEIFSGLMYDELHRKGGER